MKKRYAWASALALAVTVAYPVRTMALTNGVIMIATRAPQDTTFGSDHIADPKGPGMVTPGDVAMATLLCDHGYSCRIILDTLLGTKGIENGFEPPASYLQPADTNFAIGLVIMSGSSASADTPPPPEGIPVMMGEHVCLGNRTDRPGSIFMYNGQNSSDPNETTTPAVSKYMKVVAPNHPIMQGIPLDGQGRVKIFRERYPEEESHVPAGGKKNYEFRWCTQAVADAAAATTVLGVLDGAEDRACFGVAEKGGVLANGQTTPVRLVHMFVNENGSGGSRREFLALTEWGRILFVRAAKWAMEEELPPLESFRILDVTNLGGQRIKLSWQGSGRHNYRIMGSLDGMTWRTAVDDIVGVAGVVDRTLDISDAPAALFLQVRALP
jgi:hypothetical protein